MKTLLAALTVVLAVGFTVILPSPAEAKYKLIATVIDQDDGTVFELYMNEKGETYVIAYETDGTISGNPNPDGSDDGMGLSKEEIIDLARKLGIGGEIEEEFWDSPLGKMVTADGDGLIPVYNPGDDLAGYMNPEGGGGGGGGFDPNGGSFSSQLKKKGGSGGGGGSGDDGEDGKGDDSDDPTEIGGEELPGPPELVNPSPVLLVPPTQDLQQPGGAAGGAASQVRTKTN